MKYHIEDTATGKEIFIEGSFTFRDHDTFFEIVSLIKNARAERGKRWVFNLANCDFIDSAALGMFVIANDEASEKDLDLVIKSAKGRVGSVMLAARFDSLYTFED